MYIIILVLQPSSLGLIPLFILYKILYYFILSIRAYIFPKLLSSLIITLYIAFIYNKKEPAFFFSIHIISSAKSLLIFIYYRYLLYKKT